MREIKFRALNVKSKYWFNEDDLIFTGGKWYQNSESLEIGLSLNMNDCEVSQCLGKKGKNEIEVYEGDIIHFKTDGLSGRGIVYWDEQRSTFMIKDTRPYKPRRGQRTYPFYNDAKYRVEGNIYDNPDLITI